MKKILYLLFFFIPLTVFSAGTSLSTFTGETKTASSPENRVVLLELYTSEGCSSCPPADRFLSDLKTSGISDKQLIPIAFHVTYWDYIGWKDRFAKKQFDLRQRDLTRKQNKSTVYTPQFLMSGDDYRTYASFSADVNALVKQKASVKLKLDAQYLKNSEKLQLKLTADILSGKSKNVGFYLLVVENNLSSKVSDGENYGELLHHDYVVREIIGPYFQSNSGNDLPGDNLMTEQLITEQLITLQAEWKKQDLSIVAFAENSRTGEVLQAVRLKY